MFHVLFGGSRFVVRTLGPALILFAVCVPAFGDRTPGHPTFVGIALFEVIVLTAAVAVMWPRRFPWAGRAIAAAGAAGWGALAVDALRRGITAHDVFGLVLGFFVFGLPGAAYALQGGREPQPRRGLADAAVPAAPVGAVPRPDAAVPDATTLGGAPSEAPPSGSAGEVFAAKIEWLLATHPHLRAERDLHGGHGTAVFHGTDEAGFHVGIVVTPAEIVVHAGLAHVHFTDDADPARTAARALTCVMDLLGPDLRLRERLAGGRPYLARIEIRTPEGWQVVTSTGLVFWNYLGRREERILQNRVLPGRVRPG